MQLGFAATGFPSESGHRFRLLEKFGNLKALGRQDLQSRVIALGLNGASQE